MLKGWIEELINYAKSQKISAEIWLPDKKIFFDGENLVEEDLRNKTLEEYLKCFYQSLVEKPQKFVVSYPSEMVQVVAWMKKRGWKGAFGILFPRGQHEEKNLAWAEKFLKTFRIFFYFQ